MGNIVKNKSRVCQLPPALIEASGKWYQKPWTAIMSQSIQTKAASLQLIIAALYLLIGVVSSYAIHIMYLMLFASDGLYWWISRWTTELTTLFIVTIMPLLIGAIGLILFYGFWMDSKKSLPTAFSLILFGLFTIRPTIQVLEHVYYTYSNSSMLLDWFHEVNTYASIWGILFCLVPLLVILNFALMIYLLARYLSVTQSGVT